MSFQQSHGDSVPIPPIGVTKYSLQNAKAVPPRLGRATNFMNWILQFICRAFGQPEIIGRNEAVRRLLAKGDA